jgi:hypothetical protein
MGQIEWKLYLEVKQAIESIGGTWKGGKVSGFEFPQDPTGLIEMISRGFDPTQTETPQEPIVSDKVEEDDSREMDFDEEFSDVLEEESTEEESEAPQQTEETNGITIEVACLTKYAPCVGDYKTNPVLGSICLSEGEICATDASIMRYGKTGGKGFSALFQPDKALMSRCKKAKAGETVRIERKGGEVVFTFADKTITLGNTKGIYVDYKSAIPKWGETKLNCFYLSLTTVQEMALNTRILNKPLLQVSGTKMAIVNGERSKAWPAPKFCKQPQREPDALLMPVKSEEGDLVGFNPVNLEKLKAMFEGNFIIGYQEGYPNRPMAVWLESEKVAQKKEMVKAEATTKPKAQSEKKPKEETRVHPVPTDITIVDYSEKAVAVFGDTKSLKDKFTEMHGYFNRFLKYQNERTPGWIFSKRREPQLRELLAS